ncbi:MAG: hypothetical protein ACRD4X_07250 [Candidatus Acidiferrales bacterium]
MDPGSGKILKIVSKGADADEIWYDPGSDNYYFSREADVSVVNAANDAFIGTIALPSHSVASNSRNQHVFVPVASRGIYVIVLKN